MITVTIITPVCCQCDCEIVIDVRIGAEDNFHGSQVEQDNRPHYFAILNFFLQGSDKGSEAGFDR